MVSLWEGEISSRVLSLWTSSSESANALERVMIGVKTRVMIFQSWTAKPCENTFLTPLKLLKINILWILKKKYSQLSLYLRRNRQYIMSQEQWFRHSNETIQQINQHHNGYNGNKQYNIPSVVKKCRLNSILKLLLKNSAV